MTEKRSKKPRHQTKDERELTKIYRDRLQDHKSLKSRRRYRIDARPNKIGELLTSYFKTDKQALKRIEQSRALMAWAGWVGEAAARVSKAEKIRGQSLIVSVTDPLWMQQLCLLKQGFLKKYHKTFPGLRLTDIFFTGRS